MQSRAKNVLWQPQSYQINANNLTLHELQQLMTPLSGYINQGIFEPELHCTSSVSRLLEEKEPSKTPKKSDPCENNSRKQANTVVP